LRILNVNVENSGVYVCLATNPAGSDQVATVIDVERKLKVYVSDNWMSRVCFVKYYKPIENFFIISYKLRIRQGVN